MAFWALREQPFIDAADTWAYTLGAFDADECKKIIELGTSLELGRGTTYRENPSDPAPHRKSEVSWIMPSEDSEWLFRKMTDLVVGANDRYFNFDLMGFAEGFQFTRYSAPAGEYKRHVDRISLGGVSRKLSVVVQLTDPSEYEGGELSLYNGEEPEVVDKAIGNVCFFPSYTLHQVTPVTSGTRHSLVAWVTGPQFK